MDTTTQTSHSPIPQPPPMPPNGLSIPTFKLTTSSLDEIKPTTAGLSPQAKLTTRDLPESRPGSSQSSGDDHRATLCYPMDLKNELQSSLLSLNSTSPSSLSIDERIQLNKERQRESSSSLSDRQNYNSSISPEVPEKLFSAMQRDKQPFAYTANINDPNNRGKLDLSQIKSATMRRRLLANMASKSNDSDEDATSIDAEDYNRSPIYIQQPQQAQDLHAYRSSTQPITHHRYYSNRPAESYINNNVVQSNDYGNNYTADMRNNYVTNICEDTSVRVRPTVVHHKAPPQFYDIRQDLSFNKRATNNVEHTRRLSNEADIDRLSAELFASLNNLSSIISGMGKDGEQTRPQQTRQVERQNHNQQVNGYSTLSTFRPTQAGARSYNPNNHRGHAPNRSFMSVLPSGRTPSEYLMTGDLNYFTPISSNKEPYSMSTYYSEPLDVDLCYSQEASRHNNRPNDGKSTFSNSYQSSTGSGPFGLPTSQHYRNRR